MDDVDNARILLRILEAREETVKPREVVVRQVEASTAFSKEVFVVLERIRVCCKLLCLGLFHHLADGVFRVDLFDFDLVSGGVRRCFGLLENLGKLRVAERRIANMDSVFRVGKCHQPENEVQRNDAE